MSTRDGVKFPLPSPTPLAPELKGSEETKHGAQAIVCDQWLAPPPHALFAQSLPAPLADPHCVHLKGALQAGPGETDVPCYVSYEASFFSMIREYPARIHMNLDLAKNTVIRLALHVGDTR